MLLEVAMAVGPSFRAVAAQPWRFTLWLYFRLRDRDRIRQLERRIADVDHATLNGLAFSEPGKLTAERQKAMADARRPVNLITAPSDARPARDARLRAFLDRLERGRVLQN